MPNGLAMIHRQDAVFFELQVQKIRVIRRSKSQPAEIRYPDSAGFPTVGTRDASGLAFIRTQLNRANYPVP